MLSNVVLHCYKYTEIRLLTGGRARVSRVLSPGLWGIFEGGRRGLGLGLLDRAKARDGRGGAGGYNHTCSQTVSCHFLFAIQHNTVSNCTPVCNTTLCTQTYVHTKTHTREYYVHILKLTDIHTNIEIWTHMYTHLNTD